MESRAIKLNDKPHEETDATGIDSNGPLNQQAELRDSLESSQVESMLQYLSEHPEVRVKNEQRGDPELRPEEKVAILQRLFKKDPLLFQNRFGKYIKRVHLACFVSVTGPDNDTQKLLKHNAEVIETTLLTANEKTRVKNRRYEALQQMVNNGTYFTEEEMQRRNPILYDQLIGKYQSKEERDAFIKLSENAAAAATTTPLTDMFMAHMVRQSGGEDGDGHEAISERRGAQEQQLEEEQEAEEEYMDSDEVMDTRNRDDIGEPVEEIDEAEKDLLKEEFFTTMYRSFLEGKDDDFDYTKVDNNEEYDCLEVLDQDAEEKYFADVAEDSRQDKMSGTGQDPESDDATGEDELDAYMKTIEAQLGKEK